MRVIRTRRQTLLKLLGLVGVLEDEGVEVAVAADLELGLRRVANLLVLLYPRGCTYPISMRSHSIDSTSLRHNAVMVDGEDVQEASFRLQISMNCLMSVTSFGILATSGVSDLAEVKVSWSLSLHRGIESGWIW